MLNSSQSKIFIISNLFLCFKSLSSLFILCIYYTIIRRKCQ
nr:MAG TPA: hypothetical protein [Caudoviricetes sp.]